jgi:beta-glucosidase
MAGDEVVQIYLTHPGVSGAAQRALKGFQRVHLDRGQKKTVSFALGDRDLSIVDADGKHRIVAGVVQVWVGGGQPISRRGLPETAGARTQFTIATDATLPD